ncbi:MULTISPECIES: SycD/LcrH family type III secretion system chaperone [Yersinia]|uniref:CesD/SycD/LcrH family type III secretion system chaperone n=2 Tax=Yersinia bercovieri TaxID=634 RepID=A0A2G4TZZ4_YERBE|nr:MULTISPECIES: SycD/LcrH family type III secretion system chaperone [Yersinia]EEQ05378.1 TPR repeat-containing protein [Yersinia bercovieri ATCC 43970]MCB5303668.1 SycD/LcrH family type III secretion system chaperone [Yersinia bercovieri]MDN0103739.1 SycD/LcrH family type III secretion system chaperone [Yersinia bercovieri]PHZ26617.1 CesD/SycD/LcrH family type III secretion system chaperone [Yersinia bercovieri]QDW35033.1 CesD/SycD/LcrH family type III secretion system chaperone [Yersinia sp
MNIQPSDAVLNFMRRGGSLHMLANMDPQDLALLYEYTVQLCQGGEFDSAKRLLNLLVRFDHWNFAYWMTLGLCYQQTADFYQAIYCFSRAGQIQIDNPRPSCSAGECYLACGNAAYAEKAFRAALNWCHTNPKLAHIKQQAERGLAALLLEVRHD